MLFEALTGLYGYTVHYTRVRCEVSTLLKHMQNVECLSAAQYLTWLWLYDYSVDEEDRCNRAVMQ